MCYEQTKGYNLTGGLGLMFDTTIALAQLPAEQDALIFRGNARKLFNLT